jgi:trehalose synthase
MDDHSHIGMVSVPSLHLGRFQDVLSDRAQTQLVRGARTARELLSGRTIWNVNTTAYGGGVAEMLHSLVGYARGAGIDCRWAVITPPADTVEFFTVTKRIHNRLHCSRGDGGPLEAHEREVYEQALAPSAEDLLAVVRPGDMVILHDPQTVGLLPALREAGVRSVWRCHVGADAANDVARATWQFLLPYARYADHYVFSRAEHVWAGLDRARVTVIAPSIDAFAPKNQDLSGELVQSILRACGLLPGERDAAPAFTRLDGTPGSVTGRAQMLGCPVIDEQLPIITQVSRWDALKDPLGVIEGFARFVLPAHDCQLVLAGPSTAAVADDPEGARVLAQCERAWAAYPEPVRSRIALACLPMDDAQENAAMVNALQRRSTIIVQKSLAEGFGLTVSEGMWKRRPLVASRVGGIQDQLVPGTGVRLADPRDLRAFAAATSRLLEHPRWAASMGSRARARVRERYLATRHLQQWLGVLARLIQVDARIAV